MFNVKPFNVMKVCMLITMFCLFTPTFVLANVSIIVHPSNDSSFDKASIKKIFLGKSKRFSNGKTAILISADHSDPATSEFNSKVIGKSSSQIKAYWSKILFTGKGTPPQEMSSNGEIINAISSNPDAIGFISADAVSDSVKVVATF